MKQRYIGKMSQKSFLTTFEISQICEVNPTTVQNWVKEKKLKAYVTPGGHRRVRREDLISFMKEFGMPIPTELAEVPTFILIVDDEKDIIDLLTSLMRITDGEIEIAGARSGVEALLIIGERKPDLLILDIMMPGMNGIEVCQRLKGSPVTQKIKIVAISGVPDPAIRQRALAAGADLFFPKPLDMISFRDSCFNLLHSVRAR
ncbi:MAG: response regulator [Acidobacteriota bacterium]|jgi:excisionase family DNA binding protein